MRGFKEFDSAVRISWMHAGGQFRLDTQPSLNEEDEPPELPMAVRRAMVAIRIWHSTDEAAQHVLDRLMLATRDVGVYSKLFHWDGASYEYPSETVGEQLQNGVHVIRLVVPMDLPVASTPDDPDLFTEVASTEIRTGIESPSGEDEAATAYEVNEWIAPDQYSES
jgi:hypothetical protein